MFVELGLTGPKKLEPKEAPSPHAGLLGLNAQKRLGFCHSLALHQKDDHKGIQFVHCY